MRHFFCQFTHFTDTLLPKRSCAMAPSEGGYYDEESYEQEYGDAERVSAPRDLKLEDGTTVTVPDYVPPSMAKGFHGDFREKDRDVFEYGTSRVYYYQDTGQPAFFYDGPHPIYFVYGDDEPEPEPEPQPEPRRPRAWDRSTKRHQRPPERKMAPPIDDSRHTRRQSPPIPPRRTQRLKADQIRSDVEASSYPEGRQVDSRTRSTERFRPETPVDDAKQTRAVRPVRPSDTRSRRTARTQRQPQADHERAQKPAQPDESARRRRPTMRQASSSAARRRPEAPRPGKRPITPRPAAQRRRPAKPPEKAAPVPPARKVTSPPAGVTQKKAPAFQLPEFDLPETLAEARAELKKVKEGETVAILTGTREEQINKAHQVALWNHIKALEAQGSDEAPVREPASKKADPKPAPEKPPSKAPAKVEPASTIETSTVSLELNLDNFKTTAQCRQRLAEYGRRLKDFESKKATPRKFVDHPEFADEKEFILRAAGLLEQKRAALQKKEDADEARAAAERAATVESTPELSPAELAQIAGEALEAKKAAHIEDIASISTELDCTMRMSTISSRRDELLRKANRSPEDELNVAVYGFVIEELKKRLSEIRGDAGQAEQANVGLDGAFKKLLEGLNERKGRAGVMDSDAVKAIGRLMIDQGVIPDKHHPAAQLFARLSRIFPGQYWGSNYSISRKEVDDEMDYFGDDRALKKEARKAAEEKVKERKVQERLWITHTAGKWTHMMMIRPEQFKGVEDTTEWDQMRREWLDSIGSLNLCPNEIIRDLIKVTYQRDTGVTVDTDALASILEDENAKKAFEGLSIQEGALADLEREKLQLLAASSTTSERLRGQIDIIPPTLGILMSECERRRALAVEVNTKDLEAQLSAGIPEYRTTLERLTQQYREWQEELKKLLGDTDIAEEDLFSAGARIAQQMKASFQELNSTTELASVLAKLEQVEHDEIREEIASIREGHEDLRRTYDELKQSDDGSPTPAGGDAPEPEAEVGGESEEGDTVEAAGEAKGEAKEEAVREAAEKALEELEPELKAAGDAVGAAEYLLGAAQEVTDGLREQETQLTTQLAEFDANPEADPAERGKLEAELSHVQAQLQAAEERLAEIQGQVATAKVEQTRLLTEQAQLSATLGTIGLNTTEMMARRDEAQRELQDAVGKQAQAHAAVQDAELRLAELHSKLQEAEDKLCPAQEKAREAEQRFTALESEIAQAQQSLEVARQATETARTEETQLREEQTRLNTALESIRGDTAAAETQRAEIQSQLQALAPQLQAAQTAVAETEAKLQAAETKLETLHREQMELSTKLSGLQADTAEAEAQRAHAQSERQSVEAELTAAHERLAQLTPQVEQARAELEDLTGRIGDSKGRLGAVEMQLASAQAELEQQAESIATHLATIADREQELATEKAQIEALRLELEARQTAFREQAEALASERETVSQQAEVLARPELRVLVELRSRLQEAASGSAPAKSE